MVEGGRGQGVRAGVRGQGIPNRRPRPSAVRQPPRARVLHPETCVRRDSAGVSARRAHPPDGRMRLRPAALAVSEPLVLRASWGARGWEPALMACGLPASALFWSPRSHAWTNTARLCDMSILDTSGAAAAPRWELRRRSVAHKIELGLRRTAYVTACIRARVWTLEPRPRRSKICHF